MAKKKNMLALIGSWAFVLGVVIALVFGIIGRNTINELFVSILIISGLIVGFLNVTHKESSKFLLAAISLVILSALGAGVMGQVTIIGPYLLGILNAILMFVVPATVIVALKTIYASARD